MKETETNHYWPLGWPDWPQDPEARQLVAGLLEVGRFTMNAPASLRKSRLEHTKDRAQQNAELMSDAERQTAETLADIWQKNALIKFGIRWQKNKEGLAAVKIMRPEWYTADFKMKKAEQEALRAGVRVHEYFKSRTEEFLIAQEEKDDEGMYHGFPDYSELRRQWYAREPITVPLPWAWDYMLQVCKQYAPTDESAKRHSSARWEFVRNHTWNIVSLVLGIVGIVLTVWFGLEGT